MVRIFWFLVSCVHKLWWGWPAFWPLSCHSVVLFLEILDRLNEWVLGSSRQMVGHHEVLFSPDCYELLLACLDFGSLKFSLSRSLRDGHLEHVFLGAWMLNFGCIRLSAVVSLNSGFSLVSLGGWTSCGRTSQILSLSAFSNSFSSWEAPSQYLVSLESWPPQSRRPWW